MAQVSGVQVCKACDHINEVMADRCANCKTVLGSKEYENNKFKTPYSVQLQFVKQVAECKEEKNRSKQDELHKNLLTHYEDFFIGSTDRSKLAMMHDAFQVLKHITHSKTPGVVVVRTKEF